MYLFEFFLFFLFFFKVMLGIELDLGQAKSEVYP
jgi:hypothetical protein